MGMAIAILVAFLVGLAAGIVGTYLWGAKAKQVLEFERDVWKGKINKVANFTEEEFRDWKGRLAAARDKLEGK